MKKLSLNTYFSLNILSLSFSSLTRMKHLAKLEIMFCEQLGKLEVSLDECQISNNRDFTTHDFFHSLIRNVVIWGCGFLDATWLIYAPRLQKLTIVECNMEAILSDHYHQDIFSNLETLHLQTLSNLRSICPKALPFPALIEIHVNQCPSLEKLPLNATSANGLKQIRGEASRWNRLHWEDMATKDAFRSKFT